MTPTSRSGGGWLVLIGIVVLASMAPHGWFVGPAAAHCEEDHEIPMLAWDDSGRHSGMATTIVEGDQVRLPEKDRETRWFRLYIEESGSILVPDAYCFTAATNITIYREDGDDLVQTGSWRFDGDIDSNIPVFEKGGWYYLELELRNEFEVPSTKHVAFDTVQTSLQDFQITHFETRSTSIDAGETLVFDITVSKNESVGQYNGTTRYYGPFTDTAVVSLTVDGERVATDNITLDAGASTRVTVAHEFVPEDEGTNRVTVDVRPIWSNETLEESKVVSVIVTDSDDDGLINYREEQLGTDPQSADTDGDGLSDKREVDIGTDPTRADTDGDGLVDEREVTLSTDPGTADSDGDGIRDGREIELGTDPIAADTDSDGLFDQREVELGTDPTRADTDEDGISDAREVELGTDPTIRDTDDDGLSDGRERQLGTDPLVRDTDNDGVLDDEEVSRGMDPTSPDTDGDSIPDADELANGTDPTRADTDGDLFRDRGDISPTNPFVPLGILQLALTVVVAVALFRR